MKGHIRTSVVLAGVLVVPAGYGAIPAWAQGEVRAAAELPTVPPPSGELELRIGSVELGGGDARKPVVGLRGAFYPWRGSVTRRLAVHVFGDYAELSRTEGTLPELATGAEASTRWFTVGSALGLDVVRTRRFAMDARVGGAVDGVTASFALEGDDYDEGSPDGYVDVCNLRAFEDRCQTETRLAGVLALGARFWPRASGRWFIGADYSYLTTGRHQIAASIGLGSAR